MVRKARHGSDGSPIGTPNRVQIYKKMVQRAKNGGRTEIERRKNV